MREKRSVREDFGHVCASLHTSTTYTHFILLICVILFLFFQTLHLEFLTSGVQKQEYFKNPNLALSRQEKLIFWW